MLLVATGRAPNIEDVGLETTKAEVDEGFVKVDLRTMRTREPHLYAIGDVVGGLMLAHTAGHEGLLAAHMIAGDKDTHPMDYAEQPRATYCRPGDRIGRAHRAAVPGAGTSRTRSARSRSRRSPRRSSAASTRASRRSSATPKTGDTLGVHIIGPHATDLIAEATLAFTLQATPWEIGGDDARPPDARRDRRRGGACRRRPGDQLLMATSKGGQGRAKAGVSELAASVGLTDADLIGMYRVIATARAVDERMWILNRAGRIPFVISGQGHEGAQAAIAWPLEKKKDWIAPFYRSIATCLSFGMRAHDILTAQYAKAIDLSSGGRQMPGHYGNVANNLVSLSSPVATQMLHAVGIALAAKIRKTGQVAMTSMGEGSSNQGDVHEGLNFAAIHKLPFILCVENNGYAISVPADRQLAVPDVAARASGYGIPGVIVDGADVLACYVAAKEAVDRARRGDGPTLIEAKVIRLTAHSSDDQQTKYRSAEELAGLQAERPAASLPSPAPGRRRPDRGARGADRRGGEGRDRRGHRLRRERRRADARDRDEVGVRRGLAGRDAAGVGLRRRPRSGGPRGRQVGRRGGGRLMALKTFIEAIRETIARRCAATRPSSSSARTSG